MLTRLSKSKIYGNLATVFHRTRKAHVLDIGNKGFLLGVKGLYGRGVYSTYEFSSQQKARMLIKYGSYIVKGKIALNNFIILDAAIAHKLGKSDSLIEQGTNIQDKTLISALNTNTKGGVSSDLAIKLSRIPQVKVHFNGMIFTSRNDGHVALIFKTNDIIPIGYCYSDEDYLNLGEGSMNWNKLSGDYTSLRSSIKASMDNMGIGGRVQRHTSKDPDWSGEYPWYNGTFDGIWDDGVWYNGVFKGRWKQGTWYSGDFDGRWEGGKWHSGNFKGMWYGGEWLGGIFDSKQGVWLSGTWAGGYDENGKFHDKGDTPNNW